MTLDEFKKMNNVIEFTGIPGGDGECFCFWVNKETFTRVTGHEPTKHDEGPDNTYMLYPTSLFEKRENLGLKRNPISVRIEILKHD